VAFEPAWTQEGKARATVVIDYKDGQGEGVGTYWIPLALLGSYRHRTKQAERVARMVAQGLAREYALDRAKDPEEMGL
jgi:hypothetical protein